MRDGRRFRRPPNPHTPPAAPQGKINVTDPDSRNVKTPRGWVQRYNAQAVCNERQIVIAAEINADSPDFGHLEPMVAAAERELRAAGIPHAPEVVLADAGYWHHDQIAARGTKVRIPPNAGKRKGARPGWDGGRYTFMRRVLETEPVRALYGKRQGMIEPVFANTKFNRRIDRFLRRGRAACRSEWRLITEPAARIGTGARLGGAAPNHKRSDQVTPALPRKHLDHDLRVCSRAHHTDGVLRRVSLSGHRG